MPGLLDLIKTRRSALGLQSPWLDALTAGREARQAGTPFAERPAAFPNLRARQAAGERPVMDWLGDRSNALLGFAAGGFTGDWGNAFAGAMQGRQLDYQRQAERDAARREEEGYQSFMRLLGGGSATAGAPMLGEDARPTRQGTGWFLEDQSQAPGAITYDYGAGTVRNQPVSAELQTVLNAAAAAAGIDQVIVTSGGQPSASAGGARTGSTRHDDGNAADIRLVVGGRTLDFTNPADQAIFQRFIAAARQNGATGFGAGVDYMGANTIHVGFGADAVWGAGGQGANAPEWLRTAASGQGGATPPTTGGAGRFSPEQIAMLGELYKVDRGAALSIVAERLFAEPTGGTMWEPFTDPRTGMTGYRNRQTGEVQWNPEYMQPGAGGANLARVQLLGNGQGPLPDDGQLYEVLYDETTGEVKKILGLADPGGQWSVSVGPDGQVTMTQGRGGASGGDQTGRQAAALYPTTAADFDIVTETFGALGELSNQAGGLVPVLGNWLVSEDYQRALNAVMNILQNFLVVTSGAAVTEQEAERRARQVLPAAGDGQGTINDKFRRIQDWVDAIRVRAGIDPADPLGFGP